jgi:hypothetical protein
MDLVGAILVLPFALMAALICLAAFHQMRVGRNSSMFEFRRKIAENLGVQTWFDKLPHEFHFKVSFWTAFAFCAFFSALILYALFVGSIK